MSKPWGHGSWAAEAERAEEEEKERAAASASAPPSDAFPSLGEAIASKPRKKKPQPVSISEFTYGRPVTQGSKSRFMTDNRGLTAEEMMQLPTGPRDRSGEEEYHGGLGGAFRDYRFGADRSDRDRDRGFGAGFDRERESVGFRREYEPSRADDASDWGATKKPSSSFGGGGYDDDRRGSRLSDRELPSRADEVDNWGSGKKPLPPAPVDAYDRRGTRYEERRETLDESRYSRADEVANWGASKKTVTAAQDWRRAGGYETSYKDTGADAGRWPRREHPVEEPQRRRLILQPRTVSLSSSTPPVPEGDTEVTYLARADPNMPALLESLPPQPPKQKSSIFGSAKPREENLTGRELAVEQSIKERDSRPSSSHSSRPHTPALSAEVIVKPRSKVNPFGGARPREVLLEEKGKDWRKMEFELEHRGVDRPETEDELRLKEEIKALIELSKQEIIVGAAKMNGDVTDEDVKVIRIEEDIRMKEKELEQLTRALDDKVRFSQRTGERPGSRSGRSDVSRNSDSLERPGSRSGRADIRAFDSSERPGSRSGRGEGGRSMESSERPWSRGGRVDGSKIHESVERSGLWTGRIETRNSFESLERPRSRTGRNYESSLERPISHIEVGGVIDYRQDGSGADIWTRSNDEVGRDRRGSWVDRDRFNDRVAARRF